MRSGGRKCLSPDQLGQERRSFRLKNVAPLTSLVRKTTVWARIRHQWQKVGWFVPVRLKPPHLFGITVAITLGIAPAITPRLAPAQHSCASRPFSPGVQSSCSARLFSGYQAKMSSTPGSSPASAIRWWRFLASVTTNSRYISAMSGSSPASAARRRNRSIWKSSRL